MRVHHRQSLTSRIPRLHRIQIRPRLTDAIQRHLPAQHKPRTPEDRRQYPRPERIGCNRTHCCRR